MNVSVIYNLLTTLFILKVATLSELIRGGKIKRTEHYLSKKVGLVVKRLNNGSYITFVDGLNNISISEVTCIS